MPRIRSICHGVPKLSLGIISSRGGRVLGLQEGTFKTKLHGTLPRYEVGIWGAGCRKQAILPRADTEKSK